LYRQGRTADWDIVRRTRALIEKAPPVGADSPSSRDGRER
jgi:hypothetical protein